jgi:hypothetical protein
LAAQVAEVVDAQGKVLSTDQILELARKNAKQTGQSIINRLNTLLDSLTSIQRTPQPKESTEHYPHAFKGDLPQHVKRTNVPNRRADLPNRPTPPRKLVNPATHLHGRNQQHISVEKKLLDAYLDYINPDNAHNGETLRALRDAQSKFIRAFGENNRRKKVASTSKMNIEGVWVPLVGAQVRWAPGEQEVMESYGKGSGQLQN